MKYTFPHIASIIGGKILRHNADEEITHLLTDSRQLSFPSTTLFFALVSDRRNGHDFIPDLYQSGVRNFVVSQHIDISALPDANFLLLHSALQGLQDLAAFHRSHFSYPVIGITGSNGKTIVKEWLNQLLEADFQIVRSPRSYNSQIGVPLSVWNMSDSHTLAIIEAGISQPGEMQKLENIIRPTIGLCTNIGTAHSEAFSNLKEKATEKLLLFNESDVIIFCSDYPDIESAISDPVDSKAGGTSGPDLFSWSTKRSAVLEIKSVEISEKKSVLTYFYLATNYKVSIPFIDAASIENCIHCICVMLYLKMDANIIECRLQKLRPVAMRLELKQGINRCSIVNDSYSLDLNSLTIALDYLSRQSQHRKKTVILSEILQSGEGEKTLYQKVASLLVRAGVNRLFAIGSHIEQFKNIFEQSGIPEAHFYPSTAAFISVLPTLHFSDEAILVKGARVFELDQASALLEEKQHRTVLDIDLDALIHNLKEYQRRIPPGTRIMAMVKAFSYGSGSFEIANVLQFHKVDYLAVAYADEGVELRRNGITLPIMVMNPDESTFQSLIAHNLEPEIYSFALLKSLQDFLLREGMADFPIHLEIETGMQRLGFEPDSVDELVQVVKAPAFRVKSIFTHLVASESEQHDDFTSLQVNIFENVKQKITSALSYPVISHVSNSSGISRHPEIAYDMVRLGIGMYGVDNAPAMAGRLIEVSTLRTTISMIKSIKAGQTVGYGRKGRVSRDSKIATVRIGYADGYPRSLGNGKGKMLIGKSLVPVIGNVCMDMTMIDITDLKSVSEDQEVIVFGRDLSVEQVAKWADTIPYEILTGVSQRVKRVYYRQ